MYRGYHVPARGVLHCGLQGSDNRVVLMPGEVVPLRLKARQGRCSKASMGDQSQPGGSVSLLPQSATSVPSTSSSTEGHISNSNSPATAPMTIVTGTIHPEPPSHEDLVTGPASFHLLPSSWDLAQTQGIPNSLSLISRASNLQRSPLPLGHPQITWHLL